MTQENNARKVSLPVLGCLGFIVIVGVIALIFFGGLFGFRSSVVSLKNQIDAQHTVNKSNYDTMWKKFKEMTQVTDIQAEQFKDLYTGLIEGRNQDTGLLFNMVQEQNPTLSPEVYTNLQREIASSRNTFDNNQKKLIDIVREYNTRIDTGTGFFFNFVFNFEPIDADKLIVTSERTTNAFETNKDEVIDLKGDKK